MSQLMAPHTFDCLTVSVKNCLTITHEYVTSTNKLMKNRQFSHSLTLNSTEVWPFWVQNCWINSVGFCYPFKTFVIHKQVLGTDPFRHRSWLVRDTRHHKTIQIQIQRQIILNPGISRIGPRFGPVMFSRCWPERISSLYFQETCR